jgi:hypothetical protein
MLAVFLISTQLQNSLFSISNDLLSGASKALMAFVIFIIGLLIAKMISKSIEKILKKANVDIVTEKLNEIDLIAKSPIELKASGIIGKVVYYFLLIFVAMISAEILDMAVVSALISDIIRFFPNLVVAIIMIIIGLIFSDAIRKIVLTTCQSLAIPAAKIISSFIFYFLLISIFISALSQAGIQTDFLARNLSILIGGAVFAFAIGYGLASKETVSNFLSSSYSNNLIKIGDFIKIGDSKGRVINITKSSVTIESETSKIVVPMHKLSKENIEIFN